MSGKLKAGTYLLLICKSFFDQFEPRRHQGTKKHEVVPRTFGLINLCALLHEATVSILLSSSFKNKFLPSH
jgi:hypothetical protein